MLSSNTLNQNMIKTPYFLEKVAKLWDLRSQTPAIPPTPTVVYTATKRSNFVAHKKSILISKIWGVFNIPFLCDCAP